MNDTHFVCVPCQRYQRDSNTCGDCSQQMVHGTFCTTCKECVATKGSDDCLACTAAYLLTDPSQMALIQRLHAGTEWLRSLNAEVNRQLGALVDAGRAVA